MGAAILNVCLHQCYQTSIDISLDLAATYNYCDPSTRQASKESKYEMVIEKAKIAWY